MPNDLDTSEVKVYLESCGDRSNSFGLTVGRKIAEDLHLVANPAIDPEDDSIILTRSGSRGQQLPERVKIIESSSGSIAGFATRCKSSAIFLPTVKPKELLRSPQLSR